MSRYFLEVAYKGTSFSGLQTQHNANTIQAELEKALNILVRLSAPLNSEGLGLTTDVSANFGVRLTGSSRTDAGVHALQNFFHFDFEGSIHPGLAYKMNAILPEDIVVQRVIPVADHAHCRFNAVSREYKYFIYRYKNPFLRDRAYYFPYKLDIEMLHQAAAIIKEYEDFTSFSKRNTQVKSFTCIIQESEWFWENDCLVYHVKANRFLRGMVRALTATMLKIGREKMSIQQFRALIEAKDCTKASFAVPAQGLFLVSVAYPPALLGD